MSKQSFFQGALILVGAGLVTKLMGFINRIFLSRIIGAEGMGLYQMAVPTMYLVITLTQFGLPIAISKLVAEASVKNDQKKVKSVLKISLLFVTMLSVIFTTAMILGAPLISKRMLTDERVYYSLIGIAPIVPIVAVTSIIRGYFQGKQNMIPTASSQLIEQFVRIFVVLVMASYFMKYGVEYAAAAAMVGVVIGELAGMLSLLYQFRRKNVTPIWTGSKLNRALRRHKQTMKELLRISVPVTSGRLIGSLTFWIEPIVVAQSLAIAGLTTAAATAFYGQLQGMAMPLLTFPTFFTYSLAVSLVPAVAEASAKKDWRMVHRRIYQSLRIALIIGAPFTALLYIFAEPFSLMIYDSTKVGEIIKIMAPFCLFLYFQGPLAAALQGLDYAHAAMKNSIYGAVIKTVAIFFLATQPALGAHGITIAISIGIVLVSLLHFFSVMKLTQLAIDLRDPVKVTMATVVMGICGYYLFESLIARLSMPLALLYASAGSMIVYIVALVWMKVLGRQDALRIPIVGRFLAPFLKIR